MKRPDWLVKKMTETYFLLDVFDVRFVHDNFVKRKEIRTL